MQTPQSVVGQPIWDRMQAPFLDWLRHDRFGLDRAGSAGRNNPVRSVRELLNGLFLYGARIGLYKGGQRIPCTLDMNIGDLLELDVKATDGRRISVRTVFRTSLCLAVLSDLLVEASSMRYAVDDRNQVEQQWAGMAAAAGCKTMKDVHQKIEQAGNALAISEGLMMVLQATIASKPLWDFYRGRHNDNGYLRWWADAFTNEGAPLKDSTTATAMGTVTMRVGRYEDTSDAGIRAYEWAAELRSHPGETTPTSIAYGMVYALPRQFGDAECTPNELFWAADAVADTDVAQVMAFLQQHQDAPQLMDEGDLCFLWLWERRRDAERGAGWLVLQTALRDLKRRFRTLKTLVVNLEPSQFLGKPLAADPPAVQEARMEASEKIERYLRTHSPETHLNGNLRLVLAGQLSPDETLASLGAGYILENGWLP